MPYESDFALIVEAHKAYKIVIRKRLVNTELLLIAMSGFACYW